MSITSVRSLQSHICSIHLIFPSGDGNPSPLYLASTARDPEMVDLLLKHGASTSIFGRRYDNPLQVASKNGDSVIIQLLLDADFNVNRKGGQYGTALVAACYSGTYNAVTILLEHGADPNIRRCWKYDSALQTACERDNAEIVLQLLEHGADPNLYGGRYGSALHAAFSKGNGPIIKELLKRGADINYKGGEHHSVLQAAVDSGKEEAVHIALNCGLSPNEKGGWFTYPLLRATALDSCPDSIVRLLLDKGADPNLEREGDDFTDQTFRTALQHATSLSKATLLLDNGAKVDMVSGWLGTALHIAISHGGYEKMSLMKLLMDHGADVNQKAENIGSPLCWAARGTALDSVQLLIQEGADLSSVDIGGHSSLHWAICNAKAGEELFDYFLSLGADPLLVDRRGCNGLHYAARANHIGYLRELLEREPDINATDDFGWTPLHWAAASTRVSTQVIKALIDKGCNVEMQDKEGRTALDLAVQLDNAEAIAILNDTGKIYTGPSTIGTPAASEGIDYWCEGCWIVRNHFKGSRRYTDNFHCRNRMFVGLRSGTSAPIVTTSTISAFDVSLTRTFYTLTAIPGPVIHL